MKTLLIIMSIIICPFAWANDGRFFETLMPEASHIGIWRRDAPNKWTCEEPFIGNPENSLKKELSLASGDRIVVVIFKNAVQVGFSNGSDVYQESLTFRVMDMEGKPTITWRFKGESGKIELKEMIKIVGKKHQRLKPIAPLVISTR